MTRQRVKQWFSYRAQSKLPHDPAGWSHILQRLHESANPKPRKRSAVQQFMLEEPSIVETEFTIKYKDGRGLDGTERMNKRYDIAKQLLYNRYKHRIVNLEANARDSHKRELEQWSLTLDSIELAPDVNE